jgi:hypothetical protein
LNFLKKILSKRFKVKIKAIWMRFKLAMNSLTKGNKQD